MRRATDLLRPPSPDAGPVENLRWVRRVEIVTGVGALVGAALLWDDGTLRWVLLCCGVVGLSPWPGAAAILRKAERRPEVLEHDRAAGARRARRASVAIAVIQPTAMAVVGYVLDGWPAAVFMGVLGAVGAGFGLWLVRKRYR